MELFAPKDVGDVVTYEEMLAVELDVRRHRSIILKAIRLYLRTRRLACCVVPRVGYQVTHPDEAPRLIGKRIKRASNQLSRGHEIAEGVDRELMSQQTRQRVDLMEVSLQAIRKEVRGIEAKVERHAKRLDQHQRAIEGLQEGVLGRIKPEDMSILERLIEQQRQSEQS
jgi:hypothetical protein